MFNKCRLLLLALLILASSIAIADDRSADKPTREASVTEATDLRTRRDGSDWPRFLGPGGDGKSTETGLDLVWPASGPTVRWTMAVGEGYSMPSVAHGRLLLFDRVGSQARLTCLESESGRQLWQQTYATQYEDLYGYSTGPRASPVIDGGRVYTFGVEGRLRCHRAADGKLLWDVDTQKNFGVVQNFFGVGATPVVEGELLIVPVGGSPADSPTISSGEVKGNGSGIVAFDKHTGVVRYRLSNELASYSTPVVTTLNGRRQGFAFTRGGLLAFEPHRGELQDFYPWRAAKLESVNASTPVVVDDTVFITESYGPGGALLQLEDGAEDGGLKVLWKDGRRNQAMASHWTTPIYHQGYLYGCSGQSSGEATLRCLDYRSGKVLWSEPGLGRSTLLYVDGHFVVLTERGRLLVIEAAPEGFKKVAEANYGSGEASSQAAAKTPVTATLGRATQSRSAQGTPSQDPRPTLRFPAWNAPILAQGLLYVRGKDQLVAFDLAPAPAANQPTPKTR